jgi:hypothetical protein
MSNPTNAPAPAPAGPLVPVWAVATVVAAVVACAVYANLSFAVTNPADYRFFPPFRAFDNGNRNFELGGENFEMSLTTGNGSIQ